jgi:hypothetical protein
MHRTTSAHARSLAVGLSLLGFVIGVTPDALAGDDVAVAVTIPAGEPTPIVTANGNPYANGSYAVGTLRLEYTYVGTTFPAGLFATFELGMSTAPKSGPAPSYPVDLWLEQTGSAALVLTPDTSTFVVPGSGWSDSTLVTVEIPAWVGSDPTLNEDGDTIVANLQPKTGPGSKLGTPSSIQVKIRLVHPSACVRHYTFLSDRELSAEVTSMAISFFPSDHNSKPNQVQNVSPTKNVNQNVLLVNTCDTDETVDLDIDPDDRFEIPQPDNQNNSAKRVFIYSTSGELVPGAIDLGTLIEVDSLEPTLQLTDLVIGAGETVLVTVYLQLDGALTALNVGASPFSFASTAYEPGGTWTTLHGPTSPNPATKDVPFTTSQPAPSLRGR